MEQLFLPTDRQLLAGFFGVVVLFVPFFFSLEALETTSVKGSSSVVGPSSISSSTSSAQKLDFSLKSCCTSTDHEFVEIFPPTKRS